MYQATQTKSFHPFSIEGILSKNNNVTTTTTTTDESYSQLSEDENKSKRDSLTEEGETDGVDESLCEENTQNITENNSK